MRFPDLAKNGIASNDARPRNYWFMFAALIEILMPVVAAAAARATERPASFQDCESAFKVMNYCFKATFWGAGLFIIVGLVFRDHYRSRVFSWPLMVMLLYPTSLGFQIILDFLTGLGTSYRWGGK
jgi:hypothetical protein